jgi:hypothetical protein
VLLFGSQYIVLVVPIVVALGGWIAVVYWANNHPRVRHVSDPTAGVVAAAGAADEGEEAVAGPGPGAVPQPRQQAPETPPVPRQSQPAREDRTESARDR